MRIPIILLLMLLSINLSACSSVVGNVVPKSGPSMETVYDSMSAAGKNTTSSNGNMSNDDADLSMIRQNMQPASILENNNPSAVIAAGSVAREFHKLPNPELQLYVFPHLAGSEQVPVPGYTTAFNVYDHDYYMLPSELARSQ